MVSFKRLGVAVGLAVGILVTSIASGQQKSDWRWKCRQCDQEGKWVEASLEEVQLSDPDGLLDLDESALASEYEAAFWGGAQIKLYIAEAPSVVTAREMNNVSECPLE